MKLVLAAIMCPTFCFEEPPPLCEVEQVCDTTSSEGGIGGIPFLPIPLFGGDHNNEILTPIPPRMPELPPLHPIPPWTPPIAPPILPPEKPPTQVVPEPSTAAIMGVVAVIGLLTRKKLCPVD